MHLLPNPPLASPPDVGFQISPTGFADRGFWTTRLLDPAPASQIGGQVLATNSYGGTDAVLHLVYGRYLTRPLPAQTIGAGLWSVYAAQRMAVVSSPFQTNTIWGFTVAQWRPSTASVIAVAVDAPLGGNTFTNAPIWLGLFFFVSPLAGIAYTNAANDIAQRTIQAGSALTLLAGDCIILELWDTEQTFSNTAVTTQLLLNGLGQYVDGLYLLSSLTDTDATLRAPAPIQFS